MTTEAFLASVRTLAAEKPVYRTGGTGADGTCDCVGLVMGAVSRLQPVRYPLHSSNYFARRETDALTPLAAAQLQPGMLLYKARQDNGSLHARYRQGGQYHNGDPLDYYHMGVLLTAEPICIVHCTSGGGVNGIAYDTALDGWTHAGRLRTLDSSEEAAAGTAAVCTPDGKPLKLRPTPDTAKPYIAKLPHGDTVTLLAEADGWAKVRWQQHTGYCMSRYLLRQPAPEAVPPWGRQTLEKLDRILLLLGGEGDG